MENEATISILAEQIDGLSKERNRAVLWIAGILDGCEGCTEEARAFVFATGIAHGDAPVDNASFAGVTGVATDGV